MVHATRTSNTFLNDTMGTEELPVSTMSRFFSRVLYQLAVRLESQAVELLCSLLSSSPVYNILINFKMRQN